MIAPVLASILRAGRADFNSRFAEARHRFPALTGETFGAVLAEMVDPVVAAVAALQPECAAETASVAYDIALELAGQNLVGPAARSRAIAAGWRQLLPLAAAHVAEAPRQVLPAISNALYHLGSTEGARPDQWLCDMTRLARLCRTAAELLQLGQVLAWHAGMAHYRTASLALLASLPEQLALAALGSTIPSSEGGAAVAVTAPELHDILTRLEHDPWYDPARPESGEAGKRLRPVRRAGTFRGFGGLFSEPPRVTVSNNSLLAQSGNECWLLCADCFGTTFHRSDPALFAAAAREQRLPARLELVGTTIRLDGFSLNLGQLGAISSVAATADTLAITSPLTHSILLVAMT